MWLLTIEDDEGSTVYHRLAGDRCTLGRAPDRDVVLTHFDVSRRHARLDLRPEGWIFADEGSENGSYVNGYLVEGPMPLGAHDRVQIGGYRVSLSGGHQTGVLTPPPRYVLPARLRVLAGIKAGAELSFGPSESLTIGRGDECDLRLLHEGVTNVHALVRPLGGGRHEIVDKSGLGFFVNRRSLACKVLEGGDAINIGGVALLRYLEPSQMPDPRFDRTLGEDWPPTEGPLSRSSVEIDLEGDATDEVECYSGLAGPSSWKLRAAPAWLDGPGPLLPDERFEAAGPVPIEPLGAEPGGFARLRRATMLRGSPSSSGRLPVAAAAEAPDDGAAPFALSRPQGPVEPWPARGASSSATSSASWPGSVMMSGASDVEAQGGLDDELGQWLSEAASQWAAASESAGVEPLEADDTPLDSPSLRVPPPGPSGRSLAAYEAPAGVADDVDDANEGADANEASDAALTSVRGAPEAARSPRPRRSAKQRWALIGAIGAALTMVVAWGASSLVASPAGAPGKPGRAPPRGETQGATGPAARAEASGATRAPSATTTPAVGAAKATSSSALGAPASASTPAKVPEATPAKTAATLAKVAGASPPDAPTGRGPSARSAEGAGGRPAGAARVSAGATMEDAESRRARLAATLLSMCRSSGDTSCVAESLSRLKRVEVGP
ncbi:MAG: FHA domain-containing protein [Polyangiaceae bacterium]|nr:FHA domain-containing protein [Polyangiaceae bacterium]